MGSSWELSGPPDKPEPRRLLLSLQVRVCGAAVTSGASLFSKPWGKYRSDRPQKPGKKTACSGKNGYLAAGIFGRSRFKESAIAFHIFPGANKCRLSTQGKILYGSGRQELVKGSMAKRGWTLSPP